MNLNVKQLFKNTMKILKQEGVDLNIGALVLRQFINAGVPQKTCYQWAQELGLEVMK